MYLFQRGGRGDFIPSKNIYIPLCIYFNKGGAENGEDNTNIYIPLCIYFNYLHYVPYCYRSGDLHSTMYLFQRFHSKIIVVSVLHLHSTMYLFQPVGGLKSVAKKLFTFHYVSISTYFKHKKYNNAPIFTFHYVSISTQSSASIANDTAKFTFHYVSISTWNLVRMMKQKKYLHSTMYLFQRLEILCNILFLLIYIPLCIYFNS